MPAACSIDWNAYVNNKTLQMHREAQLHQLDQGNESRQRSRLHHPRHRVHLRMRHLLQPLRHQ